MCRKLLIIPLLFATFSGSAQVSMALQVPGEGVLLKTQLWSLVLTYTGNNPIYVRIAMTLNSASGNQPLLTATTAPFYLYTGAKQLQATDISPIQYTYLSSAITDHNPDSFLPVGNYVACYTVILCNEQNSTALAEDCASFEVEPLSPPVLSTPADGDSLLTSYPMFTWVPPAPTNLFSNLLYSFTLVEVQQGQNPADAIEQNIPIYANQNCTNIFINYPASSVALSSGQQYAWQVVALNNSQPTVQSEVWTFWIEDTSSISSSSMACTEGTAVSILDVPANTGYSDSAYSASVSITFEAGFSAGNGFSATVDSTLLPCIASASLNMQNKYLNKAYRNMLNRPSFASGGNSGILNNSRLSSSKKFDYIKFDN